MLWPTSLFLLLLPSLAYSDGGTFYTPPNAGENDTFLDNAAYTIGKPLQIRWLTDISNISLVLWQNGNDKDFEYLLPDVQNPNNYNWIIETNKDLNDPSLDYPHIFSLAVYDYGSTSYAFNSHSFNLTQPNTTATSATISTTSSATFSPTISLSNQPTTTASSIFTSSPTSTASPAASPPPDSLSSSTKVGLGLGIGAGVGIPLLVAVGALTGWRLAMRRRKRSENASKQKLFYLDAPHSPQLQIDYHDGHEVRSEGSAAHVLGSERSNVQTASQELPGFEWRVQELPEEAQGR